MSDRLALLDEVIDSTVDLLDAIPPEAYDRPTPCTEYTVGDLIDHLVGWVHVFEAATRETDASRDPDSYLVGHGHGAAFRRAGHSAVAGLRDKGTDRQIVFTSTPIPDQMVVDMMTMEYPGHGWDLTVATGRPYPFDDRAVGAAQEAAERMIQPPFRGNGEGQFRPVVATGPDSTRLERYVAFLGRDPHWSPETNP